MFLIFAAIVWLAGSHGAPNLPRTSPYRGAPIAQQNETPKAVQKNPEHPSPSPSAAISKIKTSDPQTNARPSDEDVDIQRQVAKYTFVLLIAAFLTAGVIGWQSWETRKSAGAARASTEIMRRSLSTIYRSYLVVDDWKHFLHGRGRSEISFRIFNSGLTMAKLEYITYRVGGSDPSDRSGVCPITFPPKEEHRIIIEPDEVSWDEAYDRDGQAAIDIIGTIVYSDRFFGSYDKKFSKTCIRLGSSGETFRFIDRTEARANYEKVDPYDET